MELITRILKNQYHDSVALMLATKELKEIPEIKDAAYMMATEVNKALLKQSGLLTEEALSAQANDLIISIKCVEDAGKLLDLAEELLSKKASTQKQTSAIPRTIRNVVRSQPELNLAVISVAGAYAAREARDALASGLHVLLFSDNVSLDDEIALKKYAVQRGLLLMGPGAGTAIINNVGLGFANALPQGPVGIVSAAGTGLQEVSTLIAKQGCGISQAIGTGGRDLSKQVGGLTFFAAIDALQADANTQIIVLISKPPDEQIAKKLVERITNSEKPIVLCLLGASVAAETNDKLYFTRTLEECARTTAAVCNATEIDMQKITQEEDALLHPMCNQWKRKFSPNQKYIRALFSGGTLCYETQVVWQDALSESVFSNAPIEKINQLQDVTHSKNHSAIDLGEEEFTVGRPHPMIDNDLRILRMRQEANDPEVAVIMLDVVLGYGAHPDPAGELAEAIRQCSTEVASENRTIAFVASVTGTEEDPQIFSKSVKSLEDAGVIVCQSNAQAARIAAFLVEK